MISPRHAQVNNLYMRTFDLARPTSRIIYHDGINLSEWAMSQPMPIGEYE